LAAAASRGVDFEADFLAEDLLATSTWAALPPGEEYFENWLL
jgi:hypothetical protein